MRVFVLLIAWWGVMQLAYAGSDASPTLPCDASKAASNKPGAAGTGQMLLAIRVNGVPATQWERIVRLCNGQLAASADALQRWRVPVPSVIPIALSGNSYYPLDAVAGVRYVLDQANQELLLDIPAASFLSNSINMAAKEQDDLQVAPGGFFNYDLLMQRTSGSQTSSGLFEVGGFNGRGVAIGTFLWQDGRTARRLARLETSWARDYPEHLVRLQVGDNISSAGSWGRVVRFGGVQLRRNFDTQPDFVTFPQPGAAGIATLPSTVEVYVNSAQRATLEVPPGPFEISNVPVVTGSGEVQLIVRDMLGRQHVVTQPYYASQSLLRAGLNDYSWDIGFMRENYGLPGDRYGRLFAAATHRYGVSDQFTRETRAEILADQQTFGAGGTYLWSGFGNVQGAVAASRGPVGNGTQVTGGIEQVRRHYSWSARIQASSAGFTQLGGIAGNVRPRRTYSLRLGIPAGMLPGSLSIAHMRQIYWESEASSILSVNYSFPLLRNAFLTVYAMRGRSERNASHSIGFAFSQALGDHTSASAQYTRQKTGDDTLLHVQRNLPEGSGFGYRLMAGRGANSRAEASGAWQGNAGTFTAGVSQQDASSSARLGVTGGIAFLGGASFLSRRVDGSFAVVNAGGLSNVRVLHQNRPAGVTDERGLALIPRLHAYQPNRISLEQRDLPIEVQVKDLELRLVPGLRSGVYAEFPVEAVSGGTLVLVLEDGTFVPAGAMVQVQGSDGEFPVGLRGEVFLPELADSNELVVRWAQGQCKLVVRLSSARRPLDALGRYTCEEIQS